MFCGEGLNNKEKYYCKKCYYKLSFIEDKRCLICGREIYGDEKLCLECREHKRYMDANFPSFIYSGIIKEALRKFKFAGKMWYYKPFSLFMYETLKDIIKPDSIDYIVYPPVNKKTFEDRGFNQSELIAKELSKKLKIKLLKKCIYKIRDN